MTIPASANPLLLSTSAAGGYTIERSIRLNSADSAYLSRTPASAGNRKTWTWAGWVKLCGSNGYIFSGGNIFYLYVYSSGVIRISTSTAGVNSTRVLRDNSAWYHFVLAVDSTQSTQSNRVKLYINGELDATNFGAVLTLNQETTINGTDLHSIGKSSAGSEYFNGYLADVHFIDGQALDPTSFGEFDANGVWQPIEYAGSYGTNGFHLPFSDNSTAAALGTDTSGNGNDWAVNNISVERTTPKYSANISGSMNAGYSWSSVFTNSGNGALALYGSPYAETTVTLPPGVTWSSSIELDCILYTPGGGAEVNGTDVTSAITAGGGRNWNNLTSVLGTSGTLSSIKIYQENTNYLLLFAVRIDGVILIENLGAGNDSLVDTPTSGSQVDTGLGGQVTGNYCTINPLNQAGTNTLSNGNLDVVTAAGSTNVTSGSIGVTSGKWYWEVTHVTATSGAGMIGIGDLGVDPGSRTWTAAGGWYYYGSGQKYTNSSGVSYGSAYGTGDVIGVALDMDSGTLVFYKNGVSQGTAYSSGLAGKTLAPALNNGTSDGSQTYACNFGQRPFAYPVSGFKALCDTNLPAPVVAKPNTVMDVKTYTGNGSTQTISGLDFSPDLVWIKERSGAADHALYDTVRTATKQLESNTTTAETTESTGLTTFSTGGFSLGALAQVNTNTDTYAAWCWDAGSSTVTNTDGSITSQVRANPSAGFSIVTYTGTGANATVGHGLNVAPQMIIIKGRDSTTDPSWIVGHTGITMGTGRLILNGTQGNDNSGASVLWNSTAPTSAVFSIGNYSSVNQSTLRFVAYCFSPVAGYSSFGSFIANGSTDGVFVYTGFTPRWILCKYSSGGIAADWLIFDTARSEYNVVKANLRPNTSALEEDSYARVDILSNGFKIRASSGVEPNQSGATYIYAAFAEHPFALARAR